MRVDVQELLFLLLLHLRRGIVELDEVDSGAEAAEKIPILHAHECKRLSRPGKGVASKSHEISHDAFRARRLVAENDGAAHRKQAQTPADPEGLRQTRRDKFAEAGIDSH